LKRPFSCRGVLQEMLSPHAQAFSKAVVALYADSLYWNRFSALGAEDVYRFVGNDTHIGYFRLVLREGNSLLVGGR
jgi:hypothetical protein